MKILIALDASPHYRMGAGFRHPYALAGRESRHRAERPATRGQPPCRYPGAWLSRDPVAVGGVFLFRRRMQVLLEIHEDHGSRISFRDVLGKDFRSYVGEWRIAADSQGTQVVYELEAEPRAAVARALCRGALRSAARDLLAQVRAEMMRRAEGVR